MILICYYSCFVETQVTDEDGQPLSAVLLSLSAGQFRSNNLTLDNGTMVFANLVSLHAAFINTLSLNSDKHLISPYNFTT